MKIRWVNVYYPYGEWKDESGEVVAVLMVSERHSMIKTSSSS